MKKEFAYFSLILLIFSASVLLIFNLLRKYFFLTYEHFLEVCRRVSPDFLASGSHHIGYGLSILTFFSIFLFFSKIVFSYIKTRRKLRVILKNKSSVYPDKLLAVIKRNGVEQDRLLLVQAKKDLAITIYWLRPKIVLSTGLIDKLKVSELEAVVLHEYYHARYIHPLFIIAAETLTTSLFFIPLLKDINRKFRSALEGGADNFACRVQKNSTPLQLALTKVNVDNRFPHFPSFSSRVEYKLDRANVILSVLVMLTGLLLYILPTQSHASQNSFTNISINCREARQCLVHCGGKTINKVEPAT